jgi:hypothetical protein
MYLAIIYSTYKTIYCALSYGLEISRHFMSQKALETLAKIKTGSHCTRSQTISCTCCWMMKRELKLFYKFLAYFLYFEDIKAGLWDHLVVCVSICSPYQQWNLKRLPFLSNGSVNTFLLEQTEETATRLQRNSWKTKKLNFKATEQASLLTLALQHSFLVSAIVNVFLWFICLFRWHERLTKLLILFSCS